jgi:hypothetical protein
MGPGAGHAAVADPPPTRESVASGLRDREVPPHVAHASPTEHVEDEGAGARVAAPATAASGVCAGVALPHDRNGHRGAWPEHHRLERSQVRWVGREHAGVTQQAKTDRRGLAVRRATTEERHRKRPVIPQPTTISTARAMPTSCRALAIVPDPLNIPAWLVARSGSSSARTRRSRCRASRCCPATAWATTPTPIGRDGPDLLCPTSRARVTRHVRAIRAAPRFRHELRAGRVPSGTHGLIGTNHASGAYSVPILAGGCAEHAGGAWMVERWPVVRRGRARLGVALRPGPTCSGPMHAPRA